jgi:putative NADH-flavin reductase
LYQSPLGGKIESMKIALFGATGWIGGVVAREALERGHLVTAIVRDKSRLKLGHENLSTTMGDVSDPASVVLAIAAHDAVIAALGSRREGNHKIVSEGARILLGALPHGGVRRLIWVGGSGSLDVSPGVQWIDTPAFPAEWKAEAAAQVEALKIFRAMGGSNEWTFLCPPALLEHGHRTWRYRTGGDQLLTDEKGDSRISVEDFAVAVLDELERPAHIRKRFTVAY